MGSVYWQSAVQGKSFYQKIPDIVKWVATMAIVFFSWQVFYFSDFNRLEVFMKSLIGISAANAKRYSGIYLSALPDSKTDWIVSDCGTWGDNLLYAVGGESEKLF